MENLVSQYEKFTYPALKPTRSTMPNQPGPGGSYDKEYKKQQMNSSGQQKPTNNQPSGSNEQNVIFG